VFAARENGTIPFDLLPSTTSGWSRPSYWARLRRVQTPKLRIDAAFEGWCQGDLAMDETSTRL
jgi:hypothetical protein